MAELQMSTHQRSLPPSSGFVRGFRYVYALCATLLAVGIVTQIFFAGATLLVNGGYLATHRSFAHMIEFLIIGLVIVGLLARLPWRLQALGLLAFVLMALQYVFLYTMPALGAPALRGLHTVNGLAMFWLALYVTQKGWPLTRS
jgi:membrane-bound metal-dependent hydrolase YbcI (DUF457 family)